MGEMSSDLDYAELVAEVRNSQKISVAVDESLIYIAINEIACDYLKLRPEDLIGKSAIQLYPEIIASRNHRNILKALSGMQIRNERIESRMGDILITDYHPFIIQGEVKAVILHASFDEEK